MILSSAFVSLFLFGAAAPTGPRPLSRGFQITHNDAPQSVEDSSGRVISSSQRPLPDNTQHLQKTNIHAAGRIRTQISAGERPQTYALDRAAT